MPVFTLGLVAFLAFLLGRITFLWVLDLFIYFCFWSKKFWVFARCFLLCSHGACTDHTNYPVLFFVTNFFINFYLSSQVGMNIQIKTQVWKRKGGQYTPSKYTYMYNHNLHEGYHTAALLMASNVSPPALFTDAIDNSKSSTLLKEDIHELIDRVCGGVYLVTMISFLCCR